ncbi:MAG: 2,4-dienoyl-CoA reductase-like NADH-dependent reductase (Old Yellow Enzyme family), partial [Salinirussus sp.]
DGRRVARRLADAGFDAVVPVEVSVYWDTSVVRGRYPARAWAAEGLQDDYAAAFGGRLRAQAVRALTWLDAQRNPPDPGWNARFCREVREAVDVPVLCEGGLRDSEQCERLLGDACELTGMGRPFYAEPRLGARLLGTERHDERALCESCNNCTVPQATGEPGRCRTPAVVRERGRLERDGVYERNG